MNPQELVLLYHWLGEALWWLHRYEERLHVGEEGLALVADQPRSVGVALMQQTIALGAIGMGDMARYLSLLEQTASFLEEVPYVEELAQAYSHIIERYVERMYVTQAQPWLRIFRERAEQAGDLSALAAAERAMGTALAFTGNLVGGIRRQQASLEVAIRIGDTTNELFALYELMSTTWAAGDLDAAARYGQRALTVRRRLDGRPGGRTCTWA